MKSNNFKASFLGIFGLNMKMSETFLVQGRRHGTRKIVSVLFVILTVFHRGFGVELNCCLIPFPVDGGFRG
jgi:hypothetical protein